MVHQLIKISTVWNSWGIIEPILLFLFNKGAELVKDKP